MEPINNTSRHGIMVNRFLALGLVAMFISTVGMFLFIMARPAGADPGAGTCLPISKGGTGCDASGLADFLDLKANVYPGIYPIGSIYTSITNTNPGNFLGGTWVAFGQGRTLVGLNSSDTTMDTPEETGGSKNAVIPYHNHTFSGSQMGTHNHTQNSHSHVNMFAIYHTSGTAITSGEVLTERYSGQSLALGATAIQSSFGLRQRTMPGNITTTVTPTNVANSAGTPAGTISYAGSSGNATNANMQPFITVYFWKRTN